MPDGVEGSVSGSIGDRDAPAQAGGDTARNLLLGILALQNNFVSRDDLVSAFAAWVADRSRLLGQILRDRGGADPAALPCSRRW